MREGNSLLLKWMEVVGESDGLFSQKLKHHTKLCIYKFHQLNFGSPRAGVGEEEAEGTEDGEGPGACPAGGGGGAGPGKSWTSRSLASL